MVEIKKRRTYGLTIGKCKSLKKKQVETIATSHQISLKDRTGKKKTKDTLCNQLKKYTVKKAKSRQQSRKKSRAGNRLFKTPPVKKAKVKKTYTCKQCKKTWKQPLCWACVS